ncbi:MAG TPA: ATP-binding protein, partial [Casimicrobiaceae bacterium]|nr:ATP-binding protein [Casimicrobiaceae bacterium]
AREDGAAGAGLGLAIVDRIARLHGGTLDLLPRDGGGTIARVRLPRTAPP